MTKITNHLIEYVTLSDQIIHKLNEIDALSLQIATLRAEQAKHRLAIASSVLDLGQEQQHLHVKTPENRNFFIHVSPTDEPGLGVVDVDQEYFEGDFYEVNITEMRSIRNHGEEE